MKLSIWQQFSSNHSASFSVVGVFESTEKAQEAAKTIQEVVDKLEADYHKRFPDSMDFYEWAEAIDIRSLSPFEQSLRKAYKISRRSWNFALDWAYEGVVMRVYQNLLYISNRGDTWSPFQPLDSLIKKAGGKFYASQEGFGYCKFILSCEAKDKANAEQIATTLRLIEHKYDYEYVYVQIPDGLKFSTEIEVKGTHISFKGIGIYASSSNDEYDAAHILRSLVPYLEAQGCTDFQYKFTQGKQ